MGDETSKCYQKRLERGDFKYYLKGRGIDIGCGSDILKVADGVVARWDLEQGDAQYLHGASDGLYDFVYSSHCLEHLYCVKTSLINWCRILRNGGFLYVVVPDFCFYEKMTWPSIYNSGHKHTFSLCVEKRHIKRENHWHITDIETVLSECGLKLIYADLEIDNFDQNRGIVDQTLGNAISQICIIAQKTYA